MHRRKLQGALEAQRAELAALVAGVARAEGGCAAVVSARTSELKPRLAARIDDEAGAALYDAVRGFRDVDNVFDEHDLDPCVSLSIYLSHTLSLSLSLSLSVSFFLFVTHTHTHTHTLSLYYIYSASCCLVCPHSRDQWSPGDCARAIDPAQAVVPCICTRQG